MNRWCVWPFFILIWAGHLLLVFGCAVTGVSLHAHYLFNNIPPWYVTLKINISFKTIVLLYFLSEYLQLNVNFNNLNSYKSLPVQENSTKMFESVNLVKRAICTMTLPMVNETSPHPLAYGMVTFCKSNNTVVEASLLTLNQVCVYLCMLVGLNLYCVLAQCDDVNFKPNFFFMWSIFGNQHCVISQLFDSDDSASWLSDADGDDDDKSKRDSGNSWENCVDVWWAAKSVLAVGQPFSSSSAPPF